MFGTSEKNIAKFVQGQHSQEHIGEIESPTPEKIMTGESFTISYTQCDNVLFPDGKSAKAYLVEEAKLWEGFLAKFKSDGRYTNLNASHRNVSSQEASVVYEKLIESLSNPRSFRALVETNSHGRAFIPPPSTSLFGQLVLGLHTNSRFSEACSAYLYFLSKENSVDGSSRGFGQALQEGRALYLGAFAAQALPFRKVSSAQIAGAARSVSGRLKAIDEEISRTKEINATHEAELLKARESQEAIAVSWWARAKRAQHWIIAREKSRARRHIDWRKKIEKDVEVEFTKGETRLNALDRAGKALQDKRQEEFERLLDLFQTQLRLRAPVALWEKRQKDHNTASRNAIGRFYVLAFCALLTATIVPYCFGDYIADSFMSVSCSPGEPPNCIQVFSAKGPLTLGGLLLALSILMWAVRIQYKVYLSERHLALDASEKKAFAETYLAIKEGSAFDPSSEAIVLASLFRPTQDGIIKDDDSGVDISAASIIARQLSRPGN